jgi:hypothetical protein
MLYCAKSENLFDKQYVFIDERVVFLVFNNIRNNNTGVIQSIN